MSQKSAKARGNGWPHRVFRRASRLVSDEPEWVKAADADAERLNDKTRSPPPPKYLSSLSVQGDDTCTQPAAASRGRCHHTSITLPPSVNANMNGANLSGWCRSRIDTCARRAPPRGQVYCFKENWHEQERRWFVLRGTLPAQHERFHWKRGMCCFHFSDSPGWILTVSSHQM